MYVDNLARSAGGNGVVPLIFDSLAITPKPLNTEACVRVKRGLVQTTYIECAGGNAGKTVVYANFLDDTEYVFSTK